VGNSLTSYIASVNVARRHLNKSQAAVVALELQPLFGVEAKQRQKEALERGRQTIANRRAGETIQELIPESFSPRNNANLSPNASNNIDAKTEEQLSIQSRQQAADALGTNSRYVSDAKTIAAASRRLLELVRDGVLVIPQAITLVKQSKTNADDFASFDKGKIDLDEFRNRCFLKRECIDLNHQLQQGKLELKEALAKAKQRKAADKRVKDAAADEALAAVNAKRRVVEAYKDLGQGASVDKIAARAGVDKMFADKIVCELPDEDDAPVSPWEPPVPRGEEIGVDETGALRYMAKKGEPTDRLNRPLDLEMVAAFSDLEEFEALIAVLDQCIARIDKLAIRPGGRYVNPRVLTDQLQNVLDHLRKNSPYCACPSCGGFGWQETKAQICPTCHGQAFMCEASFARLNADLQEIASGYKR
jgi:hypothetical protein